MEVVNAHRSRGIPFQPLTTSRPISRGCPREPSRARPDRPSARRPRQYLHQVSPGSLIVAIAPLARTIYTDQRKSTRTRHGVAARHLRVELGKHADTGQHDTGRPAHDPEVGQARAGL